MCCATEWCCCKAVSWLWVKCPFYFFYATLTLPVSLSLRGSAVEQLLPPGRGLPHPGVIAAGELLERQKSQDLPQVSTGAHSQSARNSSLHTSTAQALSPLEMSRIYIIHHMEAHRDTQHPRAPVEAALVVHSSKQSRTASLELQGLLRARLVVKSQVSGKVVDPLLKQRYRLLFSSLSSFLHDNSLRNADYISHRDFLNGWSFKIHRDFRYLLPPCDQISEWFHFPIIHSHSIYSKPFVCVSISHWVW